MQKHSDEALVAYLDGELDGAERRDVEAWLDADPAARDRLAGARRIGEPGAQRLRRDRQRAGARAADRRGARRERAVRPATPEAEIVPFQRAAATPTRSLPSRRWRIGLAAAAGAVRPASSAAPADLFRQPAC